VKLLGATHLLACFEDREDAERFCREVGCRLGQFHLEIEPAKTKLIEWRNPDQPQEGNQEKQDNTFTFLGFQHYGGKTRYGDWKLKRRTSSKKFRTKLREITDWLRQNRNRYSEAALALRLKSRWMGYRQYYAITDNTPHCWAFEQELKRLLFKWLNRRS
jgi:hypothetical protein